MSDKLLELEKSPGVKREFTLSVAILLFVVAVIGSFIFFQEYDMQRVRSSLISAQEEEKETTEEEMIQEEEKRVYKERAQEGEGVTHLARRAVNDFLEDRGEQLGMEERVYMEDHIRKHVSPDGEWLELGEEREIPEEIIEDALEEVRELGEDDLDNLRHYASLINP